MVLKHHCCVPAQSERTSASCGVTFCPSYAQKTALGGSFLFAAGGANQVHLSERSALDGSGMDSTIILFAVFCIGFLSGYGVRALISQIRRQKVRRLRQSRSFTENRHSSPRLRQEASITGVTIPNFPLLGPHCTLAAAE
jgi:hypothetical protein